MSSPRRLVTEQTAEVGRNLRTARLEAGWTQAQVASVFSLSAGAWSHYETGTATIPQERLARFYQVIEEYAAGKLQKPLTRPAHKVDWCALIPLEKRQARSRQAGLKTSQNRAHMAAAGRKGGRAKAQNVEAFGAMQAKGLATIQQGRAQIREEAARRGLLDGTQAAEFLEVAYHTVYTWTRQGKLVAVKIGRASFYDAALLAAFKEAHQQKQIQREAVKAQEAHAVRRPRGRPPKQSKAQEEETA